MIIYKITNNINNKMYIGQTIRPLLKRFKEHKKRANCSALYEALKKYGEENFTIELIENVESINLLNEREQHWITFYNTLSPNGYNLTSGGNNGRVSSEETKQKLSNFMKGKVGKDHPGYGHKVTEEHKKLLSDQMKNRIILDETKKKMSESAKGNQKQLGKKRSEETKLKMSQKKKGLPFFKKRKPVTAISKTGEFFNFDSVDNAATSLNIGRKSISNCLNGWSKSAGNYTFKYTGDF
jgi:group I intron endonuclease